MTSSLRHSPPAACSWSALRQAARHVTRAYDDALRPVGLGLNQYSVLVNLDRNGPQALQVLADRLVMDRSTLGHLLRPLEHRGLLTIGVALEDRRGRTIALSTDGIALLGRAKPLWAAAETRFEDAFGREDAAQLRGMLARAADVEIGRPETT